MLAESLRASLSCPGWLRTQDPPASGSRGTGITGVSHFNHCQVYCFQNIFIIPNRSSLPTKQQLHLPPPSSVTTVPLSVSADAPLLGACVSRITLFGLSVSGFFHSASGFRGSFMRQQVSVLHSFSQLSNIPRSGEATFCLPLMHCWVLGLVHPLGYRERCCCEAC